MRPRILIFALVGMLFAAVAHAKPTIVDTPLKSGGNVPSVVAKRLGEQFKAIVSRTTQSVPASAIKKALKKLRLPKACETIACAQKLATELEGRFVLFTSLTNEDDTYSVSLKLYDLSSRGFVRETKKNCEFCAAKEVKGTFVSAWKTLKDALNKAPTKPKPKGPTMVSILTIPPGAAVVIDGKAQDKPTPLEVKLGPGEHKVEVTLEGYVSAKRTVMVKEGPVELPIIEMVKKSKLATDQSPITPNKTSSLYGVSLGMLITGSILSGTGLWLIAKDGTVVCTDGRGRTSCPEVYNTKYLGFAAGSAGALLIGASSAMLLKDYLDTKFAEPESAPKISIAPEIGGSGMSLQWGGRF